LLLNLSGFAAAVVVFVLACGFLVVGLLALLAFAIWSIALRAWDWFLSVIEGCLDED
jgi:hypothetical protein